ncbi:transposase [Lachnospiraceae bacterium ZAX-1]
MGQTYTDDFKIKIAQLRESGKSISGLMREYKLAKSTISTWHTQYCNSGSFKAADDLSDEGKELKALRKENKQLKMEVGILRQAALIMGRNGG